ncbi:MAG TPA: carboxymuconolactone decarboxylase family protein [Candidatus Kryptonia bacterium]|nr:carboxymuconolactone decarboxylase family protein [Candidatus Kryptonia bacterium]
MNRPLPVEYASASPAVREVFDDIKATRNVQDVNNFWKCLANDPALLKRTWNTQKQVLAPGALDRLVKELIYLAVSVTNGCSYGIACHTALAHQAGMTDAMFGELMAVVGMANQTNRFADGFRLPIDPEYDR